MTIEQVVCCKCGLVFGIESEFLGGLKKSHKDFYCPNGHGQHFYGKTEADKLRDELARTNASLDQSRAEIRYQKSLREHQERKTAAVKGQLTKVKRRVGGGVCPCCNRYFPALHRHMTTKHPTQADQEEK